MNEVQTQLTNIRCNGLNFQLTTCDIRLHYGWKSGRYYISDVILDFLITCNGNCESKNSIYERKYCLCVRHTPYMPTDKYQLINKYWYTYTHNKRRNRAHIGPSMCRLVDGNRKRSSKHPNVDHPRSGILLQRALGKS